MARKSSRVRIKGADEADKQQIAAARAANEAGEPNTKNAAAAPEAAPTAREAREAAQKLFDKADEEGKAAIIRETSTRRAVFG